MTPPSIKSLSNSSFLIRTAVEEEALLGFLTAFRRFERGSVTMCSSFFLDEHPENRKTNGGRLKLNYYSLRS